MNNKMVCYCIIYSLYIVFAEIFLVNVAMLWSYGGTIYLVLLFVFFTLLVHSLFCFYVLNAKFLKVTKKIKIGVLYMSGLGGVAAIFGMVSNSIFEKPLALNTESLAYSSASPFVDFGILVNSAYLLFFVLFAIKVVLFKNELKSGK